MTHVNCAQCGRSIFVALTTREIESGEIARRLCPERCVGEVAPRVPPERKRPPKEDGAPIGETRSRLYRIDRELGEAAVVTTGPKLTPKPALTDRIEETELLNGLAEYRSLTVSACQLAKRWNCQPEDIYKLDIERSKAMARKQSAESAEKLERARSLRQQGETLRYIAETTGLSISYLSQKLKDVPTPGMKQAGYGPAEPADSEPDVEELTAAPESASESLPDGANIKIAADSEEGQSEVEKSEAEEADLDELAEIMRGGPDESELWSLAHKLRNEGASQSVIQRETGFSRGKIRRRLWPSKPRPPTTLNGVCQMRQRLVDTISRYEKALKAVDILIVESQVEESDRELVGAAAAVMRSVGIKDA